MMKVYKKESNVFHKVVYGMVIFLTIAICISCCLCSTFGATFPEYTITSDLIEINFNTQTPTSISKILYKDEKLYIADTQNNEIFIKDKNTTTLHSIGNKIPFDLSVYENYLIISSSNYYVHALNLSSTTPNLIDINTENSYDSILVAVGASLDFNGKEVAPNLNRLKNEGIYFSNYYAQASSGTSSDSEFTFSTAAEICSVQVEIPLIAFEISYDSVARFAISSTICFPPVRSVVAFERTTSVEL